MLNTNPQSDSTSLAPDPISVGRDIDTTGAAIDPKWQELRELRELLVRRRDELIDAISEYSGKAREVTPDPIKDGLAETGTESFQRDQLLGVVSLDQEILDEVNAALARIEAGTYGICEVTGQPISLERLKEIPWTRFSIEAQREMEEKGQAGKAALGSLGTFEKRPPASPFPDATTQSARNP